MGEQRGESEQSRRRSNVAGQVLFGFLRLIGRHLRGFYGAVLTYLSFSFFLAVGATWAFLEVVDEVLAGSTQAFDELLLTWIATHRSAVLDIVALEITALGNVATLTVLVLTVWVFLWLTRHRVSATLLLIAVAGGALLNVLLKDLVDRPRPLVVEAVADVMTLSFPSGHSMSAFTAYASVAYLVGRLEPSRVLRWTTWGLASLLILGVGTSRVYLGVHYPTDVVGGYLGGLAWLGFVISGLTAVRYFSNRSATIQEAERDLDRSPPDADIDG
jgi:undecaprenyl-diphosphatase